MNICDKNYGKKTKTIVAIILAAGAGKRIGRPKWQLLHNNKTFLDIVVTKLLDAGMDKIVCVARRDSTPKDNRIQIAINEYPDKGMFSSIFCGVSAHRDADGYLIFPVDHPYVETATLAKLCQNFVAANRDENIIISPSYMNRLGHPIIISDTVAKRITVPDYVGGLKQFLIDQCVTTQYVTVDDANIMRNINTLND